MAFSVGPGIQLGGGIILGAPNLGPPGIGNVITTSTTSSYSTYAVTVPFTAPCPNVVCSPILYYQASSVPSGQVTTGTTSPLTVSNLLYKVPYTFTVSAVNANGVGAASVTSNSVPGYGQLWSWGYNGYNQLGLGSIATTNNYVQPTIYGLTTTWSTSTSQARINPMWIQANGSLWAWGYNGYGQLGTNNTTQYSSPKQIGALTNWLQVSGAYTTAAIKTDGTLWTWGYNGNGQLGLGNTNSYSSPKQVGSLTHWRQVSVSGDGTTHHVLAVKTDNTLWAWGYNGNGQLGTANTTNYSSPKQIGASSIWAGVVAGYQFSLAVDTSGKLWSWGYNANGMLGLNNATGYSSPKQVGAMTNWSGQQLYTGNQYTSGAIKTDGTLWMWGYNGYGELGTNNTTQYSSPKQIGALTTWRQLGIGQWTSAQHTMGITADGKLWGWGYNGNGQLGVGNTTNYSSPKQVGTSSNWHAIGVSGQSSYGVQTTNVFGPLPPTSLTATALNANTFKVTMTSPVFTSQPQNWTVTLQPSGQTQTGQSLTQYYYNLPVAGIGVSPINYAFTATTTNPVGTSVVSTPSNNATGTTYLSLWGYNGYGALGTNNTTNYSSPKNLGTYAGWGWQYNTISTGNYTNTTAAITNDGKLFTWGYNNDGQLGNNTTNNYSSPVQLGANSNWAQVAIDYHGLAVDTSGRLWSWGYNGYGQLGLNNTANYSSPKQVGALTNWAKVYTGYFNSYAIKTDGTLWAWGYNGYSMLGTGNATNMSSPVQIGSATSWTHIAPGFSCTMGMQGNYGYGWGVTGSPAYYQFFVGSSGTYSTPAAMWSNTAPAGQLAWCAQTRYSGQTSNAGFQIDTSGRLWYGGNGSGAGNGGIFGVNSNGSNTYGQVGALTNWWWVQGGDQHVVAMTTSGTIYAWGYNGYGQLGLNDTSNRSSPVQIGTLSNWNYPLAHNHTRLTTSPEALGQYITMLQHT